jgi:predicted DNA-binding transcriptional regulator AlpA
MDDMTGHTDRLLTQAEVSAMLAIPRRTLRSWRSLGRGPAFVRIGKAVRYRAADIDEFVGSHRVERQRQARPGRHVGPPAVSAPRSSTTTAGCQRAPAPASVTSSTP